LRSFAAKNSQTVEKIVKQFSSLLSLARAERFTGFGANTQLVLGISDYTYNVLLSERRSYYSVYRVKMSAPLGEASGRRRAIVALAVAMLVVGATAFFVFPSLRTHSAIAGSVSNAARKERSIAVLPFENLSYNKDDAFFADGVQDDVLTKLARISELKVISHTSVMHYRGSQDARKVGKALGVLHLLDGTVRRYGTKVHVNARLVNARTGTHVWAGEYDCDLNEVFAIETEVAQSVASQLGAKVSAYETTAMEERPTKDLVAYDLYVHAAPLIEESLYYGLSSETNLFKAVELLNQAIARDPTFLLAYCQLARATTRSTGMRSITRRAVLSSQSRQ
jgi:TolB-like protein